jgi:hypothetical protein
VAEFGHAKIKRKSKNQVRRGVRDFDQTAFTLFQKATGVKQSKTRRWKCFETPGVEPVCLDQEQAIDYAQSRACFRSGLIRVLDCESAVRWSIPFTETNRRL